MNGYPYPVLTENDSAYNDGVKFSISFLKYAYEKDRVKLSLSTTMNSETLKELVSNKKAEFIIKAITDIRSILFRFDDCQSKFEIEINSEDIRPNDTIKLTAYIVVKEPFNFKVSEEMRDYFGETFSIDLKKGDILAISNDEKLNYNTSNNDFIKIKSSESMCGKGIRIRLSDENHIEILVSPEFKHAYAVLKDPKISPILGSHIVFEAFVYTLVEIAQQKEDHSNKEWYRLFSQAFEVTGDTLEEFRQKAIDDGVDMSYIYEVAQAMISNSLETTLVKISKMEVSQ